MPPAPIPRTLVVSADGHELDGLLPRVPCRLVVGLTGAPGTGKSTLAAHLAAAYDGVVVPMDGFHLADAELARRGLLEVKGAPETFDAWGYAALLERVHRRPDHVVMAPGFERALDQPLAGVVPVPASAELVVTEGNYLLLDDPGWTAARASLDLVWHLRVAPEVRLPRLVARHVAAGRSPAAAREWVARVDEANARLVEACAGRADLVLDLTSRAAGSRGP